MPSAGGDVGDENFHVQLVGVVQPFWKGLVSTWSN